MSFELDPVFHTETMVKILYAQGQTFYATKLCEEILTQHPEKQEALHLLEGIKKGKIPEKIPSYQMNAVSEPETSGFHEDETTEPGITFEALEMKEEAAEDSIKKQKLELLEAMLHKVQERKYY